MHKFTPFPKARVVKFTNPVNMEQNIQEIIPGFDGKKKQLTAWLTTVKTTLDLCRNSVTPEIFSVYEQTAINKIEGKARDTICVNGNPANFEEVAEILQNVYAR